MLNRWFIHVNLIARRELTSRLPPTIVCIRKSRVLCVIAGVLWVSVGVTSKNLAFVVDVESRELGVVEVNWWEVSHVDVQLHTRNSSSRIHCSELSIDDIEALVEVISFLLVPGKSCTLLILCAQFLTLFHCRHLSSELHSSGNISAWRRLYVDDSIFPIEYVKLSNAIRFPIHCDLLGSRENHFLIVIGGDGQVIIHLGEKKRLWQIILPLPKENSFLSFHSTS